MTDALLLTQELIKRPSITPDDQGCQELIGARLQALGFTCTHLPFNDVKNLWARFGEHGPLIVFAGHTDVVPPGPIEAWTSDPFTPTIRGADLFGRGAADMKSGLAAMITATERFLATNPNPNFSIGFLITSDEEAVAADGTRRVVEYLQDHGEMIDYCIVGEASSEQQLGDTIKNGRRGTLSGKLTVKGIQGHIAYPQTADNPIHRIAPFLLAITEQTWCDGNDHFQPTSFQISNIHAGTGANNVIPGQLMLDFNFRYSPKVTAEELQHKVKALVEEFELNYQLEWHHGGEPFLTEPGKLTSVITQAISELTGVQAKLSTAGGTSDGRFIAKMNCQVIEFGPINATIHKIDEKINVEELHTLSKIYERVLSLLS